MNLFSKLRQERNHCSNQVPPPAFPRAPSGVAYLWFISTGTDYVYSLLLRSLETFGIACCRHSAPDGACLRRAIPLEPAENRLNFLKLLTLLTLPLGFLGKHSFASSYDFATFLLHPPRKRLKI